MRRRGNGIRSDRSALNAGANAVAPAAARAGEPRAVLRPGQPVTLLNISSRAALVESAARLRPGAHTEMQLAGRRRARQHRGPARSLLRRGARADSLSRRADVRRARRRRRRHAVSTTSSKCPTPLARSGTCYSRVRVGATRRATISGLNSRLPIATARGIDLVIGHVVMDAGPNITIASPRQLRRADRRAGLDLLLRHVASDLDQRVRSPQPVAHPHRAAAPARARAQRRPEGDLQHDVAAIAAAGSRARLRGLRGAGEGRGPAGDARGVVRRAHRARRLDLPAARSGREHCRRCCSRPSGWPARRRR